MEPEIDINQLLNEYDKTLPRKIIDGKSVFDFDSSPTVLFIACIIIYGNKALLLKRSDKVSTNKDKWSVIAGYYDEVVSVEEKAQEELREEANIFPEQINKTEVLPIQQLKLPSGPLWYIVPVVISLNSELKPQLNWENTDFAWVTKDQLEDYDLVVGIKEILMKLMPESR